MCNSNILIQINRPGSSKHDKLSSGSPFWVKTNLERGEFNMTHWELLAGINLLFTKNKLVPLVTIFMYWYFRTRSHSLSSKSTEDSSANKAAGPERVKSLLKSHSKLICALTRLWVLIIMPLTLKALCHWIQCNVLVWKIYQKHNIFSWHSFSFLFYFCTKEIHFWIIFLSPSRAKRSGRRYVSIIGSGLISG